MITDTPEPSANAAPRQARGAARKTLPVALLMEGRRCLVVGGGTVAGRKAESLLDAGAAVVLVAPDIGGPAEKLRDRPGMTLVRREYVPGDLDSRLFLVVTATDDHALNRRILDDCRSRGILCACPDTGWQNGDFISPASFRQGDLTVSVSTGGLSCRRSRMIKESLARHAEGLGVADLLVVGTDHRFSGGEQREALPVSGERQAAAAAMLRQILGVHEFMLLRTCNRFEFAGVVATTQAVRDIVERVLGLDRLGCRFYVRQGREAFGHLALLAAGLLSRTAGETHICAQVKAALDDSRKAGWSGGVLHDWVGRALHVSKAIRRATEVILGRRDVEAVCADFLEAQGCGLRGRSVLVVGSGMIGRGMVEESVRRGAVVSCCYHIRVPEVPASVALLPWESLPGAMAEAEVIVCAVGGGEAVLTVDLARQIPPGRRVVVVDLGVPRNVAPGFATGRKGVRVADLEEIERACGGGDALQRALAAGDRIILEHGREYDEIRSGIQGWHQG